MRIQPWMKAVAGVLMLVAAQTETSGQSPVPPGPTPPPGAVMMPGPGVPMASPQPGMVGSQTYYPQHSPPSYPQTAPQNLQPWPQVSPFYPPQVAQTQHFQDDGLWFKRILNRGRKHYGSVELMMVSFRNTGDTLIGSPYAEYPEFIGPNAELWPLGEFFDLSTIFMDFPTSPNVAPSPTGRLVVDDRVVGFPALDTTIFNSNSNGYQYRILETSDLSGLGSELGVQLRWGFENEDGTGAQVNGWWAFEDDANFVSGDRNINGVPVSQALTLSLDGQNLFIHGVVPYFNGEPILGSPFFGLGTSAKYDVLIEMKHKTQAGGTNISFYSPPVYQKRGMKIRPLWGGRYTFLNEEFSFIGIDSGMNYTLDMATRRPATNTTTAVYQQYTATLGSDVKSHIAGPEIGFRIDLGDDRSDFKMWSETIIGVSANHESIHLGGDNIGDPLYDARFVNILNPRMLDPANDSTFTDEKSSTHVSPIFQQSIQAQFHAFRSLPLIRKAACFENAAFRFGYTFFWIGEVARPAEAIEWQGFPLFPEIKSRRDDWWMHQLNFGIDWTF